MKTAHLLISVMVLLSLCACTSSGNPSGQLDAALAQAQAENKPVLVDFYTTWCPPCKRFNSDATTNPKLIAALDRVVLTRIDAERGHGATLAAQYEVTAYPTFVLLKPNGETMAHWTGYHDRLFISSFEDGMSGWTE